MLLQQQQKLQELQGQIAAHYPATSAMAPQTLPIFLPFLEQLRGLQTGPLPPGVGKSPITNHVSKFYITNLLI